ncbi:MAG: alpha/beta hydrolase [Moraxellaceae bacterium]|nr:alpha/beta hydrolase [Moraxellaceae bacterium]MDP1776940.1 alpha/beta hydrolase [Moraxellaceae bacterium]
MTIRFRLLITCLSVLCLSACNTLISIDNSSARDYHSQRRGDMLSTGKISAYSRETTKSAGIDINTCLPNPQLCQPQLLDSSLVTAESGLSSLAELWLSYALARDGKRHPDNTPQFLIQAYLEVARFSYGYLFTLPDNNGTRSFADRQTQVRDFYNFASERIATLLLAEQLKSRNADTQPAPTQMRIGDWQLAIKLQDLHLAPEDQTPVEAIPVSRIHFSGLRNGYQSDGIGAPFLVNTNSSPVTIKAKSGSTIRSRFIPATVLIRFPSVSLDDLMRTKTASIEAYNPDVWQTITLQSFVVPLSANYTAPYAYWLANNKFGNLASRALFSSSSGLSQPEIHLLQPYDPKRRIVVLVHGLASSPEAWVNLANDVLGDGELRRHYQIWQVFYPTSVPIAVNTHDIRLALQKAINEVDPQRQHVATQNITLVGHSMGGVISRLLLLDSGDKIWDGLQVGTSGDPKRPQRFHTVAPYLTLTPMEHVNCAVFLASPHRGTPFANHWIAQLSRQLVRVPITMVGTMTTIATSIGDDAPELMARLRGNFTSIHSLSDNDPYLQSVADLPIKADVAYFSIIGQVDKRIPLEDSSDGIVPYRSAHLPSARSETIINAGHSVQETTEAIVQLRRILREPECRG